MSSDDSSVSSNHSSVGLLVLRVQVHGSSIGSDLSIGNRDDSLSVSDDRLGSRSDSSVVTGLSNVLVDDSSENSGISTLVESSTSSKNLNSSRSVSLDESDLFLNNSSISSQSSLGVLSLLSLNDSSGGSLDNANSLLSDNSESLPVRSLRTGHSLLVVLSDESDRSQSSDDSQHISSVLSQSRKSSVESDDSLVESVNLSGVSLGTGLRFTESSVLKMNLSSSSHKSQSSSQVSDLSVSKSNQNSLGNNLSSVGWDNNSLVLSDDDKFVLDD